MVNIGHRSSKSTFSVNNIMSYVLIELSFYRLQSHFFWKRKQGFTCQHHRARALLSLSGQAEQSVVRKQQTFWSGRIRRTPILFLSWFHSFLILSPSICWQHLVVLSISDNLAKKRNLWIAVFSSSTPTQWTTFAVVMAPLWRLCFEGRLAEVSTEHTSLQHPMKTFSFF